MEKIYKDIEKVLFSKEEIKNRVKELGEQITRDLEGEEVVVVGILKGCALFFSDLIREIDLKVDVDFMICSSYENDTKSSGNVKIIKDTNIDVNVFWTIFRTMIISEFFDRSQISALSMSSIFNFSGVLIGSGIALTLSCYLGAYHGKDIIKVLKEKVLSFLLGCIFIIYGIQVYIGKKITLK